MTYPEYVWMSYGWYTEEWWLEAQKDTDCSVFELQVAIQRSLSIHHFPLPTKSEENAPTDVGYVSSLVISVKWWMYIH